MVGTVPGATPTVGPGHNGYAGFRLTYDYYEGVLAGDCVKDVNAGGGVSAEGLGERGRVSDSRGDDFVYRSQCHKPDDQVRNLEAKTVPREPGESGRTQWGIASIYDDGLMVPWL